MKKIARARSALACLSVIALLGSLSLGVSAASALPPTATIEDGSPTGPTTAHVAGAVDPQGNSTQWRFDYIADAAYQHNLSQALPPFQGAATGPQGNLGVPQTVEGELTGLDPGATYHLRLFVKNAEGNAEALAANFTTEAIPPTVTSPANSPRGQEEVGIGAYVTPNGAAISDCHFEYGPTTAYGQSAPCAPADEVQSISATATAGTYRLRFGADVTADIPAKASASLIADRLRALGSIGSSNLLDTENRITFVRALAQTDVPQLVAEDGSEPLSGGGVSITTITAGGTPATDVLSAQPNTPGLVHATLASLTPGATYHVRLFATNAEGTTPSEDGIFTVLDAPAEPSCANQGALGASFLPDCRAWEMVSPPAKSGNNVIASTQRTLAALDGSAFKFSSLGAFADAHGTGIATEYVSHRSPGSAGAGPGWSTHALTPPQAPLHPYVTVSGESRYLAFSPNLEAGIFFAFDPLTDDPGVAEAASNLYRRTSLLTPGLGTYQLLTACPLCQSTTTALPSPPLDASSIGEARPILAGATPDLSKIAFETRYNLTADAPAQPGGATGCAYSSRESTEFCRRRLYEWEDGALRLAGILPGGQPADLSIGGRQGPSGNLLNPHVVSDGSDGHTRIFFTQPTDDSGHTVSEVPGIAQKAVNRSSSGNLYMRLDGSETVQINLSERDPLRPVSSFGPATYQDASLDGQRVFFSTSQALTDDAPVGGGIIKLYMYDTSQPGNAPHNLTLLSGSSFRGMVGAASDGSHVYFLAAGGLLPGFPDSGAASNLYMWHEGDLARVGGGFDTQTNEILNSGGSPETDPRQARVSPDGRFLLFAANDGNGFLSAYGGTDYDHDGNCLVGTNDGSVLRCRVLYLFDATTNSLRCISCNAAGVASSLPDADMSAVAFIGTLGGARTSSDDNHPLSADGGHVFFSTGERLVDGDTNGAVDAYQFDLATDELRLLSSGTDPRGSWFLDATPDGSDAFIGTSERLSQWDFDASLDVYDARAGGGFPEPRPVPAPCSSAETCRQAGAAAPPPLPLGSGQGGPGNRPARLACPKGERLVKAKGKKRCLKPRRHRGRDAGKSRRAGR